MSLLPKLLLATNNAGKKREIRVLLEGVPFEIVTLQEMGIDIDVAETGDTYEANARLKVCTLLQASGLLTLGDDSGLEVDALNGEPGVRSARYAGDSATDQDRIAYLLHKISHVPFEKRTARFVCVMALAFPGGDVWLCEGVCHGLITLEPKGTMGHGYDPVFLVPGTGKTMAEMDLDQKNLVSHRGQATREVRKRLMDLNK